MFLSYDCTPVAKLLDLLPLADRRRMVDKQNLSGLFANVLDPLTPLRLTVLTLTFSNTLPQTYVLPYSPIQEQLHIK